MNRPDSGQNTSVNTRVSLFEMPVDIGLDARQVIDRLASGNVLLSYLNPYAYSVVKTNPDYASDLRRFDLVVCDGIGVQIAIKAVFKINTAAIPLDFYGIGHDYLQMGASRKKSLCLVGGDQDVVDAAKARIDKDYPGFRNVNAFSGYGDSPDKARKFILESDADLVLAGLGMGKQESFLLDLVDSGWCGSGICVGGFFDKLANPQLKYPKWTEKTRLKFLGRLIKEPRRLSRRYFIDYQSFIGLYFKHLLGLN